MSTAEKLVVGFLVLVLAVWNVVLTMETGQINRNGRELTAWANDSLVVAWARQTHAVVSTLHIQANPGGSMHNPPPPPPDWE
ncbi:MAG: hypothetical protein HY337_09125 [Gemmatimonadetes bacterium]|nr:hypothetical protein [Gemmatimonadota bacterium]